MRGRLKQIRRQKALLMLLVPGLLWYFVFRYLPMAGIAYAFTDFGFRARVSFVGLDNFRRLFLSFDFGRVLSNTLIISFYNLAFFFPLPIVMALLMNEVRRVKVRRAIQFIVYMPHFFSWVVVGGLFAMMLSPSTGVVNAVLEWLGLERIFFMANPRWFRWVLVSSRVWRDAGYSTVIYVATLATIDPELYDAAHVDGAGRWAQTWHITLPSLRSTITTVLLLTVAGILKLFEQVLVMYNNAVRPVAEVLWTYAYTEGLINGDIAYATTIGLFTSLVSFILVFGVNKLSRVFLEESIL